MFFRTAGFQPAHDHEAGWKPAVRKTMTHHRHRSTALRSASLIGSEASSASVMGFTGGRRR